MPTHGGTLERGPAIMVQHSNQDTIPVAPLISVADSRAVSGDAVVFAPGREGFVLQFRRRAGPDGRYAIIRMVAHGGMGVVFEALDTRRNVVVALKRPLLPAISRARAEMFLTETLSAQVQHPAVVAVTDANVDEDGLFLVSEFVPGEDLATRVNRAGPLPRHEAAKVFRQLCHAVAATHRAGLIHRDIKPSNIVIDDDGNVHLVDFGLARGMLEYNEAERGAFLGTRGYAAPEQVYDAARSDHRSDLYALGRTMHTLLTGAPPEPWSLDLLDERWQPVVARAAHPLAELRHTSALEMLRDIDGAAGVADPSACGSCGDKVVATDKACPRCKLSYFAPCVACQRSLRAGSTTCGHCKADQSLTSRLIGVHEFGSALVRVALLDEAEWILKRKPELPAGKSFGVADSRVKGVHSLLQECARRRSQAEQKFGQAVRTLPSGKQAVDLVLLKEAVRLDRTYLERCRELAPRADWANELLAPAHANPSIPQSEEAALHQHLIDMRRTLDVAAASGNVEARQLLEQVAQAQIVGSKGYWKRHITGPKILLALVCVLVLFYLAQCALMSPSQREPKKNDKRYIPSWERNRNQPG